ncbi:MAG TPA: M28 family peptidase [Vicinamibacterales bacterium]|nr:M28 family peptidase [Vicinamibacterales bacterium]
MKIAVAALIGVLACATQAPPPAAPKFDGTRAFADLTRLVQIGPRPAGSPALDRARDYIRKELKAAGLTVEDQPFEARTPLGAVRMVNLRATLPGAAADRGRIVIGGHYDTKLEKTFRFVGASDGASSAAFLLEIARALKGRSNPLPIELLFLDGEEAVVDWHHPSRTDHTYGSRYYVEQLKQADAVKDVRAFILVDMIGDRDLGIRREQHSTGWLKDIIWETAAGLGRAEFIAEETAIEDDHLEFLAAGIDSVDIIDLDDAEWHTAADSMDNVSPRSLQVVGDVLLAALPRIEQRLK